jgi:hypothetical protein
MMSVQVPVLSSAHYRGRFGAATAALLLGLSVGPGVSAQPASAHPCADQPDDRARLACYDRAFPPPSRPAGAGATVPVATAQAASAAEAPSKAEAVSRFGLPVAAIRAPDELDRIRARVVSSGRSPGGDRIYVLDNGQRWRQLDHASTVFVADGDEVHIERATMAGFRLVTAAGSALRVRRLP